MGLLNNQRVLNRRQSRELDRLAVERYGLCTLVLMENAGRGTVDVILELGLPPPFVICCGKGNNGGDGFAIARHLEARGQAAIVLLTADPSTLEGDALANYRILLAAGVTILPVTGEAEESPWRHAIASAGTLVDALLGTGASGEPRSPLKQVIEAMNASGRPILAVDLPSGLDADTGIPAKTAVRAQHTCTFAAIKPGLLESLAQPFTGRVHVVSLGVPSKLLVEVATT